MKKSIIALLKKTLKINIIAYATIYIIFSFVMWQLKNPFQWIIDIPTYEPPERFCLLILYFTYQFIVIGVILTNKQP